MGKGSKLVKGGSWMSKHARNLLSEMPIDNRASGKGMAEYGKMGPGKHGMHKGPGKHHPGMAEYGKPKGPGKHGYGPHMEHDGPAQFIKLPESTKQKFRDLVNPDKYKGALTKFKNTVSRAFKNEDPTSQAMGRAAANRNSRIQNYFSKKD